MCLLTPVAPPAHTHTPPQQLLSNCLPLVVTLQALTLSGNPIGAFGMGALARVLPHCSRLCELRLDGCELGDDGIEVLAGVLPLCPDLVSLNAGSNNVTDGGAKVVAGALPKVASLTRLELFDNPKLTTAGTEALAAGVNKATTWLTVVLDDVNLTPRNPSRVFMCYPNGVGAPVVHPNVR